MAMYTESADTTTKKVVFRFPLCFTKTSSAAGAVGDPRNWDSNSLIISKDPSSAAGAPATPAIGVFDTAGF